MSKRFACIMAGGSGTRFWPQSRAVKPKQFLALQAGGESLLQAAVRRVARIMPSAHIFVVTSQRHAQLTAEQLPELPAANILAEPSGRNTSPCVGWAAAHVQRLEERGVMAVLPADPHIDDDDAYCATLERALDAAEGGGLVTVGIEPTRPETGYGYVEPGEQLSEGVRRVARFIEKPDEERARQFVRDGLLWNSGMFFFRADVIRREVSEHLPELAAFLSRCDAALADGSEDALVQREYDSLPSISIDYGIMERAKEIQVVAASFGWHDVGSWMSAWELAPRDEDDNAVLTDAVVIDSSGCYIRGVEGKLIAAVGLRDLVIVDTPDALLILPRERAQDVRAIVDELKKRDDEEHL